MIKLIFLQFAITYTSIAWSQFNTIKSAADLHLPTNVNNINDTIVPSYKSKTELLSMITIDRRVKYLKFFAPLQKVVMNSNYGLRHHPLLGTLKVHCGIDLKARYEAVFVIANGIVTFAGNGKKEGNYVIVKHNNIESLYCHLSVLLCQKGDSVKGGSCIGISGNSGLSTGPHLHFGMRYNKQLINPAIFLQNINLLNRGYNFFIN